MMRPRHYQSRQTGAIRRCAWQPGAPGMTPGGRHPNEHSQGAGPPGEDPRQGDVVVVPKMLSIAAWIASMAGVSGVAPAGVVPTTA
jgi:hypothetical protein